MSRQSLLTANLGEYQVAVDRALTALADKNVMARIWKHDHTVWKPEPGDITNRLGWLTVASETRNNIEKLDDLVKAVKADGYTHALLLGMGGSSLAPEVFELTFGPVEGFLTLAVLDSTTPEAVLAYDEQLDLEKTVFIVATKSGGTAETLSFFKYFYNRVASTVGKNRAGRHFVAITDPGSKLEALASKLNFRATFLNNPNIGGRFSVLSYFGQVAAALVGVNVPTLLERALTIAQICGPDVPPQENPAAVLGAIMGELAKAGRDKVTLIASPPITSFGDWVEQLIAESTGKEGKGILPVVGAAPGTPEVYGPDRLFVYLCLAGDDTYNHAVDALEKAGQPVVRINLDDRYDLGGQFFLWELATAVAGARLEINPFDQPNVESAKVLARQMIAAYHKEGRLPDQTPALTDGKIAVYGVTPSTSAPEAFAAFVEQAQPGDYISLQAYLPPTEATTSQLKALQTALRDWTKLAVTYGFGPRFLHSTGQLHKGDAGNGLFIQITANPSQDASIPDEAGSTESAMTFGVLIAAQAMGDRQALIDAGRRAIRFDLGDDIAGGLNILAGAIK
ncbi:MAG: glucose-6-phosphate isomerase [Anaerolineae bacterium]|nr:glucose-6-phosphate isomerase [Anaerolineae bacterium]